MFYLLFVKIFFFAPFALEAQLIQIFHENSVEFLGQSGLDIRPAADWTLVFLQSSHTAFAITCITLRTCHRVFSNETANGALKFFVVLNASEFGRVQLDHLGLFLGEFA